MRWINNIWKQNEEIISYLIVGVLSTVVSFASYIIAVSTVLNPNDAFELQIANIFSWICAVAFAYFTNRKYVFKSKNKNRVKELTSFVSSRVLTLFVDMAIMFFCVTMFKMNDKIAKIIVQVVITILNYLLSKLIVFKKKD